MIKKVSRRFSAAYAMLTPEQNQLREAAAQFVDDVIKPDAELIDENGGSDLRKYFRGLGELGMLGITCPEKYGGSDLGYLEHSIVCEEVSRGSGSVGVSYATTTNLCLNQIVLNANEEQKMKYLPPLCSGDHIGALAMSETGSGSDVMSMKLKADKVEGGWKLNGHKMWITNGPVADTIVVYARTDPNAKKSHGITAFIVENTFDGFSIAQKLDKFGIRGSPTGELLFEDCYIPDENLLGEVNKGAYVLMRGLNYERLILGAFPVGIMQACMDEVMPYVVTRKQFDQPIGEFQLIQDKLAYIYTSLEASRAYLYSVGLQTDKNKKEGKNRDYAGIFLYSAKLATQVALEAMQAFGGNGYINDYPHGRFIRDAKSFEILGGTAEVRKLIIGRDLVKEYS